MEENKYYVPEFSEFNDGLEYEALHSNEWFFCEGGNEWMKQIWHPQYRLGEQHPVTICRAIEKGWIRVPFLTKEDIEAEGFDFLMESEKRLIFRKPINYQNRGVKTIAELLYNPINNWCLVYIGSEETPVSDFETIFAGTTKNKSKFKDVLKMIGV